MYKYYIRLNEKNEIIKGFCNDFEKPIDGDILIKESPERCWQLDCMSYSEVGKVYKYDYINGEIVNNLEVKKDLIKQTKEYKDKDVDKKRKQEYPSIEELIVALWEKIVENKPESANAIQLSREEIKAKYPKEK